MSPGTLPIQTAGERLGNTLWMCAHLSSTFRPCSVTLGQLCKLRNVFELLLWH